jgi:hypothetical protein
MPRSSTDRILFLPNGQDLDQFKNLVSLSSTSILNDSLPLRYPQRHSTPSSSFFPSRRLVNDLENSC